MAFDLDDEELEATRKLNGVAGISEEETQKVLDELYAVRPEMLNDKAKRLFDAIMQIADDRDKANAKLVEYEKQIDLDYVDKNYVSKEYHEMVVKEQNDIIEDLKEKNKKLEEEKASYVKGYTIASDEYVCATVRKIKQKDFYEKVIDMMEQDLLHYNEKQVNLELVRATANGDTIKEYYFKKARENKS